MRCGEILFRQCLYPRLPAQGVVDKVVRQHGIGLQGIRGNLPAWVSYPGCTLGRGACGALLAREHPQTVDHAQLESQKCHKLRQADNIGSRPPGGVEVTDGLRGGVLGVEGQKVRPVKGSG